MSRPAGQLSALVQAVWSASVPLGGNEPVVRHLFSDAGSGILFALAGDVRINNDALPHGVILCPVARTAKSVTLQPGAQLAGIRFHPAMGYGILGQHYDVMTRLAPPDDQRYALYPLFDALLACADNGARIDALLRWAQSHLGFSQLIPLALERALEALAAQDAGASSTATPGQRQVERLFRHWLDMTPKRYQRILRVKQAASHLMQHRDASLADVAIRFGFSDQSHMTREFRAIACITPGQV
ncbi:helix-turn-helix domain-containing protein [Chitinibacteraceae bacterium HSL-7]